MKGILGMLLGENPAEKYDPNKFAPPRPAPVPVLRETRPPIVKPAEISVQAPPMRQPVRATPPEPAPRPEQRLYGSGGDLANNPNAQSEPTPLGCWLVSQPGTMWPVRQDLKVDTIPLQARTAIASACVAPIGCGSAALYDPESFMSPIETSQPVIATGSLINTYTGEVSDLFEDAMPPPDNGRDAGDAVRERKSAQRRLMAAEGNVTAAHHKREQQDPIQPGDAGVVTQLANFQINSDVATECNERACRDLYFNRNELAPTELEMTRNPFGFEGYNNRVRINPYLLPTQDLDDKNWTPNATLLPGGDHRPKNLKTRLRKDRPRTDYAGQVTGMHQADAGKADVRRSKAARDEEGRTEAGRCVNAQALYGDAAVVSSGQVRLSHDRTVGDPRKGVVSSNEGPALVTASSVLTSLGYRGEQRDVARLGVEGAEKGASAGNAAHSTASRRAEMQSEARLGVDGGETGGGLGGAQRQGSSLRRDADRTDQRRSLENLELAGTQGTSEQREARRRDSEVRGTSNRAFDRDLDGGNPATGEQRLGRSDSLRVEGGCAIDGGVRSHAFAGSEERQTLRREARPTQTHGASSSIVGAGTLLSQKQRLGDKDAYTIDPSSLFSTLTGFDGAGVSMTQRQTLREEERLYSEAPRSSEAGVSASRVDVSAANREVQPQLVSDRRGQVTSEGGHKVDAASLSVLRQSLYGDAAHRDVQGPVGGDMTHAQAQSGTKKFALDDRGNIVVANGNASAAGAHGAFGEMQLRSGLSELGEERASGPHLNGGFLERNSKVSARNARGDVLSHRRDNFRVGGDTDFQKKSALSAREWKNELLVQPSVRRSAGSDGQRCLVLPAREQRKARVAKSPFRGHAVKERGGLNSMLAEKPESRYETDEE